MCQGVEQGAPQQVAGVEKEKERKEIRDRIKHMIIGLAGPKAFLSTSVRRWRESVCGVLQLSSGVACVGESVVSTCTTMCTESRLVRHPLAGWLRRSLLEEVKEREIVLPDVRLRLYFTLILIQLYLGFWGFGL